MEPTRLRITDVYHQMINTTITLAWDPPPQGVPPVDTVDHYMIYISTMSESSAGISVPSSPWNVTLERNVVYSVSVTAGNCAGQSTALTLDNVKYGEYL